MPRKPFEFEAVVAAILAALALVAPSANAGDGSSFSVETSATVQGSVISGNVRVTNEESEATTFIAISGALVWILLDFGIVSAGSARGISYVVLLCLSVLLAVGMSWSHVSKAMSGQVDMDQTD